MLNHEDAQQLKENKAKVVHCKVAPHSEGYQNILCKITLEDVEHPIPVSYINIQGIQELCLGNFKYLKELSEDNLP